MNVLRIAARSVLRNTRRTVVTTGAIALAAGMMIFYCSLVYGLVGTLERNAVSMELGEIQIHAPGYRKDPDLYKTIPEADALIRGLEGQGFAATTRLLAFGLAASGSASGGVQLRGVDLAREPTVTKLHEHVRDGKWLDVSAPKGVVLGNKLAQTLGVTPGSEIVVLSQATDGSMANDLYQVRGVLQSVTDAIDRAGFLMIDSAFRELMALESGAHEITVHRRGQKVPLEEAGRASAALAPGLETKSWRELRPALARYLDMFDKIQVLMQLLTYLAVAMVALNATLMNVFERIREFGLMKALGVGPMQVASIIFFEVGLQALAAAAIGSALAIPVSLHFQAVGIDLSAYGGRIAVSGVAMDAHWYPDLRVSAVLMPLGIMGAVIFLAAVYPALKAAMIRPLEAMRYR